MYRYIVSASKVIDATKLVNTVANSLYKKLPGAYKKQKYSNECVVYSTILYQIPNDVAHKYSLPSELKDKVNQMDVKIGVATYSNKIRVSLVQISPLEKTIGFKTFKADTFNNVQQGVQKVLSFVSNAIEKEYEGYEVLF